VPLTDRPHLSAPPSSSPTPPFLSSASGGRTTVIVAPTRAPPPSPFHSKAPFKGNKSPQSPPFSFLPLYLPLYARKAVGHQWQVRRYWRWNSVNLAMSLPSVLAWILYLIHWY
jgi:hypothetical protein